MIDRKKPIITVIGLGHAGLPTAIGLAKLGWQVIGVDHDYIKAQGISQGKPKFYEPEVETLLNETLNTGHFRVELDCANAIRDGDVIFICVDTPTSHDGSADVTKIQKLVPIIANNLNRYKIVVVKSTSPVKTAEKLKVSILSQLSTRHKLIGDVQLFDIAVNPEFLQEGTAIHNFLNPDRIVLGVENKKTEAILLEIYNPLITQIGKTVESSIVITDINSAEIIKHASNAFLATKISFSNMLADLCESVGANIDDVIKGIGKDPRVGPDFLKSGIGYGGDCLTKDLRALNSIADHHGNNFSILKEVDRVNIERPIRFINKLRGTLQVIRDKTIAIWGLSYKPGTDDTRQSPSLVITELLIKEEAHLRLHDPRAMGNVRQQFGANHRSLTYCSSPEEAVENADALLLLTDWPEFLKVNLNLIRKRMRGAVILDGRNLIDPKTARDSGFEYHSIGRP